MAIDIGELRGILTLQDNFSGGIDKAAKGLGVFSESFGAVTKFVGLAVGAIGAGTAAIVALGVHGADVADVQKAFEGLTARAGESADVMLGALNAGTLNTISNFELMKLANTALGSGMIKNAEDMGTLAQGAQLLADRTGGTAAEALATLTEAMAKGTSKQAGLKFMFRDSTEAVAAYAQSVGKTPAQLSPMEEATAKSQAALKALREELDRNGPASADFGDNIAKGRKAVQDLVDNLGVAIATSPVVGAGMQAMGDALQAAFGGTQQSTIKTLMGFVSSFAIALTYVGQGAVVAGQVLVQAFYAAKTAIGAVMTVLVGVVAGVVAFVDTLAGLAQKIPGHAKWIDTFAASTDSARVYMEGLTKSLGEETAEAAKGAIGHSAASATLDKMGGVLINVRGAMEAAQRAQGDMATGADTLRKGVAGAGEAATLTAAQIKAMEDATIKAEAAISTANDNIAIAFETLQQDLSLANKSGLDLRLAEIALAQQKEIAGYQWVAFQAPLEYDKLVAAIKEKYGIMAADATASFAVQTQAAISWRDSSVEAAQKVLDNAEANLARLAASKQKTEQQMADAHAAVAAAEDNLDEAVYENKMARFAMLMSSASTILRALFGKSKAAAIAAAIIDTIAAVVKTMAAYPWPWSLIPAAAAAAAGYAEVKKIRDTDIGFAQGSRGFVDFGRESIVALHGVERVQTREQAAAEGEDVALEVRALRRDLAGRQETIHVHWNADSRELSELLLRRNRAGLFRVVSA